jgi:Ca2+-transporting ATPase
MKFYCSSVEDVLGQVQSAEEGLSTAEAQARLQKNGKNKLAEGKKVSLLRRFLGQLAEPMTIILLVAAAISAGLEIYEGLRKAAE